MYFYKSCRKRVFFIPLEEKEDNPSKFEALEEIVEIEEAGAWLKMVKESPGSPGMLENRPTHEILKCQSALRAILAGVAAYFYCFFPKIYQLFQNFKNGTYET